MATAMNINMASTSRGLRLPRRCKTFSPLVPSAAGLGYRRISFDTSGRRHRVGMDEHYRHGAVAADAVEPAHVGEPGVHRSG